MWIAVGMPYIGVVMIIRVTIGMITMRIRMANGGGYIHMIRVHMKSSTPNVCMWILIRVVSVISMWRIILMRLITVPTLIIVKWHII
ncbi:MAG TPA: hypothetical protein VKV18_04135 [Chthonomonas sp.]|uniref:hypothetical protein n=1 Tax=Chthonomonas sp. TaxID=2282153 RepID=UPI002B4B4ADD|nr:hypothetical protein [Chthonomonas sp.]HLI47864.1 hypothetical protein [Chthonomonas sp.]